MDKIIVRSNIPMALALQYASLVVQRGRISARGESYCYASISKGQYGYDNITVYAKRNKTSDTLTVIGSKNEEDKDG